MAFAWRIWCTDIEIADDGTSSRLENQPSPTCCCRQRWSSSTTMYGAVGLEIGRRIVEGEVRVLADADERDVDRLLAAGARPRRRRRSQDRSGRRAGDTG